MSHLLLSSLIKKTDTHTKKQNRHKRTFSPRHPLSLVEDNAPSAAAGRGSEYVAENIPTLVAFQWL